jgi:ferredoxin
MLEEFSKVATGENFRERVPDRLRHRCFRKGKYILEKFGKSGCVGCGRCIITCPAKINILEIFNLISTAGSSI